MPMRISSVSWVWAQQCTRSSSSREKTTARIREHSRLAIKCSRICSAFDLSAWFLSKCSTLFATYFVWLLFFVLLLMLMLMLLLLWTSFFFLLFANFRVFCTRWATSNLYHLLIHLQNLLLPIALLSRWHFYRDTRTLWLAPAID